MGSQRVGHDWVTELNWTEFTLIHGPKIPGSYAILFFTTLGFTFITSHIHNTVLLLFWLCLFILPGVISPLISSSTLDTYRPGEFIFQCPIFLSFHTILGVLKGRILKWFAISFSVDHMLSELSTWPVHLGWPYIAWLIVSLSQTKLWSMWSFWFRSAFICITESYPF